MKKLFSLLIVILLIVPIFSSGEAITFEVINLAFDIPDGMELNAANPDYDPETDGAYYIWGGSKSDKESYDYSATLIVLPIWSLTSNENYAEADLNDDEFKEELIATSIYLMGQTYGDTSSDAEDRIEEIQSLLEPIVDDQGMTSYWEIPPESSDSTELLRGKYLEDQLLLLAGFSGGNMGNPKLLTNEQLEEVNEFWDSARLADESQKIVAPEKTENMPSSETSSFDFFGFTIDLPEDVWLLPLPEEHFGGLPTLEGGAYAADGTLGYMIRMHLYAYADYGPFLTPEDEKAFFAENVFFAYFSDDDGSASSETEIATIQENISFTSDGSGEFDYYSYENSEKIAFSWFYNDESVLVALFYGGSIAEPKPLDEDQTRQIHQIWESIRPIN